MKYELVDQYIEDHLDASIDELSRLCAQPSVAAQNLGIEDCAQMAASSLKERGFNVQIISTGGSPVVFAERKGKSNQTLVVYNHYDVQPPEPLELWDSPPFEPNIRDGRLYARGVADNKGNFINRLHAIDAILSAEASAKIDFRLVPDQTPEKVRSQLRAHLDRQGFTDIEIIDLGGNPAVKTDPNHPAVQMAVEAARDVYEHPTRIVPLVGGSGPNYIFKKYLDVPIITSGASDSENKIHAPNESMSLDIYVKGAKHFTRILRLTGA